MKKKMIFIAALAAIAAHAGSLLPAAQKDECEPAKVALLVRHDGAAAVDCNYASIRAAVIMRKLAPTAALIEVVAGCGPNEAMAHADKLAREGVK